MLTREERRRVLKYHDMIVGSGGRLDILTREEKQDLAKILEKSLAQESSEEKERMISMECAEIGEKLLYSREYLQEALDMAAHAKRPEDVVSSGIAKDMINECKKMTREVELTGDEAMRLEVSLTSALDLINKADYDAAISKILEVRRSLLDLMFQKVVACECQKRG